MKLCPMLTMVQDTPQINGIVNTLIQEYDAIFMNKDIGETATALYDYYAVEDQEISFKQGDTLKILSQGEDGWWQGEINGKIGRFPGSYVKVEYKTKKQQFVESMQNVKKKTDEERAMIKSLTDSKSSLEKEIHSITSELLNFDNELKKLKIQLMQILKEEKLVDFQVNMEKYHGKLAAIYNTRLRLQESKTNLKQDLTTLRRFIKNPPSEAKKTLKGKLPEKLDAQIGALGARWNADTKLRTIMDARLDNLYKDESSLRALTQK